MKKITLFISLLTISLGFSQSLPFNFSAANQLMFGDNCTTSLTTDAGDDVMQIIGGGQQFDNAQKVFAENLNLADNANNTITFRIKPVNGTGSGSHLLKFENGVGGPVNTELPFTTTGTAWQNITINFGSGLGNYPKIVIFTDFNNNSVDTYLIDDIAGGTNIAPPPPLPTPSGPAPTPTLPASQVISMYGETYPNTFLYPFGEGNLAGQPDLDPSAAVNIALKYNFSVGGAGAGYTQTDLTAAGMQFVNFDYWTPNATTFIFYMISNSPVIERIYTISVNEPIVLNSWKTVSIPLTYFSNIGFNPATWFQYKFDVLSATPGTVYIDNVYFSTTNLATASFETSKIKMYPNPATTNFTIEANSEVEKVSVINLLGQEVISKNTNSQTVTLDIANLEAGVYVVKATSNGAVSTSKMIKN